MKLNNKGFAITAVLYGLLILFVILVSSYLLVLSAKKDRVDTLTNEIEENYSNSFKSVKLINHIRNLYLNNKDQIVTNNGIEYQYSTSVNLMNDRLGGTTPNYDDGNIRYYGASPNNYIYFNCDDYNNQSASTCEKWRIIGIVDGKVKIIRAESLGKYSWDCPYGGDGFGFWSGSTLKELLNNGYYNNSDGVRYYNNNTTPITINFKTIKNGIKNNETRGMISNGIWYMGEISSSSRYASDIYIYERNHANGEVDTITAKIGLIYASDYGYAADLSVCNQPLANYSVTNCTSTDWLFNNEHQWLTTATDDGYSDGDFSFPLDAWYVNSTGFVSTKIVNNMYDVSPTIYLDLQLTIFAGDGSASNPYQIAIN